MKNALDLIDAINERIGQAVSWMTLFMVLTTLAIVILRKGFDLGWMAMQESVLYLHAAVFMAGAAFALRHEAHVRVDILYRRFPDRIQGWIDLVGTVFLLFPVCGFIAWMSWEYVAQAWALKEGSREAGGLPWVYLLKTLIPLACVLLIIQGVAQMMRTILCLRGELRHPQDEEELPGEEL